jgi:hypothetical protein
MKISLSMSQFASSLFYNDESISANQASSLFDDDKVAILDTSTGTKYTAVTIKDL